MKVTSKYICNRVDKKSGSREGIKPVIKRDFYLGFLLSDTLFIAHTVILPDWTLKELGHSNFAF